MSLDLLFFCWPTNQDDRLMPEQLSVGTVHLHIIKGRDPEAMDLVERFHYSRRNASAIAVVGCMRLPGGLFGDKGACIAACFFGWPPARWGEEVLELVRLVRDEAHRPQLTKLIARTSDFIRREKICDLLVSYADPAYGHHGGIYQAASWKYHGERATRMEGVMVDGQFFAGRQSNNNWGTQSPEKLRTILGGHHVIKGVFDQGKHLYWRALTKNGARKAKRLGLRCEPYPKPDRSGATTTAVTA